MFYVQTGEIKIVVTSEQGKEAVVGLHVAGDFFGEGCLSGQTPAPGDRFGYEKFHRLAHRQKRRWFERLNAEPGFAALFIEHLLTRNGRIEADLVDQLFNSSEKRLARTLLLLAKFGKDGAPQAITAKVSQETLAGMVGTTRSRISFFMNKFRRLGFIEYNGHLQVHSSLLTVLLRD